MTCFLAWATAVLLLPVLVLLWATESKAQRIRRWRSTGRPWRVIAAHYGVSQTTVRRWSMA